MSDNETPKHTKIRTFKPQPDETMIIETKSYHEKLSGYKEEVMQHINTSRDTFLSDLVASVDVITKQKTREVTLVITADERYQPKHIEKTYVTKKETYNKR